MAATAVYGGAAIRRLTKLAVAISLGNLSHINPEKTAVQNLPGRVGEHPFFSLNPARNRRNLSRNY
jgi:hypothetical protein